MKKYFYSILTPLVLFSGNVLAQTSAGDAASQLCKTAADCPIQTPDQIFTILSSIVGYVYKAFFIVAILFILIAAFSFLNAKGDPTKIESAKKQITWAVVAIVIALLSVGASQIINSFLTSSPSASGPSGSGSGGWEAPGGGW